jgi:large subunit ribosomal protein L35
MKTLRSLAKRVKISGTGKVMRRRAGLSHNNTSKSRKRKRYLKRQVPVSKTLERKMQRLLPTG